MTAVFPTRFPVPITATAGSPIGSDRGGSKRKSGPLVRNTQRQHPAGEREPLGRREHRLVRQVDHDLGRVLEHGTTRPDGSSGTP